MLVQTGLAGGSSETGSAGFGRRDAGACARNPPARASAMANASDNGDFPGFMWRSLVRRNRLRGCGENHGANIALTGLWGVGELNRILGLFPLDLEHPAPRPAAAQRKGELIHLGIQRRFLQVHPRQVILSTSTGIPHCPVFLLMASLEVPFSEGIM